MHGLDARAALDDRCPDKPARHDARADGRRLPAAERSLVACMHTDRPDLWLRAGQGQPGKAGCVATGIQVPHPDADRKPQAAAGSAGRCPACSAACRHLQCAPASGHGGPAHRASLPVQPPASPHVAGPWGRARSGPYKPAPVSANTQSHFKTGDEAVFNPVPETPVAAGTDAGFGIP